MEEIERPGLWCTLFRSIDGHYSIDWFKDGQWQRNKRWNQWHVKSILGLKRHFPAGQKKWFKWTMPLTINKQARP